MRLFDAFKPKRQSLGRPTRVLVASVAAGFDALMREDADIYRRTFAETAVQTFATWDSLFSALAGVDVAHVFCEVGESGLLAGTPLKGADLVDAAASAGVKLLWVASGNPSAGYIAGFPRPKKPMNLVMTLDRKGSAFTKFLGALTARMAGGQGMGAAWNSLAPQNPSAAHAGVPDMIGAIELMQLKLPT